MKQVIKIDATYEFTKEQEEQWNKATEEQRKERIHSAKESLLDTFEDFDLDEFSVEIEYW